MRRTSLLAGLCWTLAVVGCNTPPSAKDLFEEGLVEYRAKDYISAQGLFEESLHVNPEHYQSAFYAGMCHKAVAAEKHTTNDYAGAMRELDLAAYNFGLAIESYPGYMAAIQEKASVLEMKGEYQDAVRMAIWAKDNTGTDRGQLIMLARKQAQGGDYDGALISLKQAVALNPNDSFSYAELGRFYMRTGREEEAITALERAYHLNPSEPGVVENLAHLGVAPVPEDAPPLKDERPLRLDEPPPWQK